MMSTIYIQDDKKHTVREYYTNPKIVKAIETLLKSNDDLVWSETQEWYEVRVVEREE
jgi:hypothetical protein